MLPEVNAPQVAHHAASAQESTGSFIHKDAPTALRIGYLLSKYPAISHSFFLQEVLGLRALGVQIETASINPPDRSLENLPAVEADEARRTFYIKGGKRIAALARIAAISFSRPGVLMRGVRAVCAVPSLTVRQRVLWIAYLAEALLIGKWMEERQLKHLHVHFGGPVAAVGMLTSMAWKIPYSLTIHGPEELLNVASYHLREKIQQASFVLCISDFCRSQLLQITSPSQWHRFYVSRLGVTASLLQTGATASRTDHSSSVKLVCTGRLVPEKAQRILLQAVRLVLERGIALEVELIGDGPDRASLQAYVQAHGMQQVVHFAGALSHPETLQRLQQADLFALASFAEGIPVALMEAMALRIPCISTTIAGIPELIRHGQDGLLVSPSNVEELADAVALLATHAELRQKMGTSAHQRVTTDYNLSKNHLHLAQLLHANINREEDIS